MTDKEAIDVVTVLVNSTVVLDAYEKEALRTVLELAKQNEEKLNEE